MVDKDKSIGRPRRNVPSICDTCNYKTRVSGGPPSLLLPSYNWTRAPSTGWPKGTLSIALPPSLPLWCVHPLPPLIMVIKVIITVHYHMAHGSLWPSWPLDKDPSLPFTCNQPPTPLLPLSIVPFLLLLGRAKRKQNPRMTNTHKRKRKEENEDQVIIP